MCRDLSHVEGVIVERAFGYSWIAFYEHQILTDCIQVAFEINRQGATRAEVEQQLFDTEIEQELRTIMDEIAYLPGDYAAYTERDYLRLTAPESGRTTEIRDIALFVR